MRTFLAEYTLENPQIQQEEGLTVSVIQKYLDSNCPPVLHFSSCESVNAWVLLCYRQERAVKRVP